jgi:hypothetical protein
MDLSAIERLIVLGDLSKLSPDERWSYYIQVCRSVGLNPATQPFQYITLSGKLVLYATKGAAEQLRDNNHVSIDITSRERIDDLYVVTARATTPDGRHDEEIGAVPIGTLKGDALANALMKATTKAKRRVTLSMIGLGMLDETEVETIPNVRYETNSDVHGDRGGDLQRIISPERATLEEEYRRLATLARARDYRHVAKLNATNIAEKTDDEVGRAVATLKKWEASLGDDEAF